ncbi:hypothetical protein A8950_3305 [Dongia mobilis]|uniref:Lipoprotein n=1 Tax=Dongia mobilis TaxID=578943 RepID=A0A4R6WJI6_9PROT|nr:hypothetical protein [Dongia mobilis]TDQ78844.1 hypothetical protein A8950_3305 [Dongia mobilis]
MRRFLTLAGLMLLAACGGENPQLVEVIRPTDPDLSCMDLLAETSQNDLAIARLVDRDDQIHRRNVHYTVVDGIMFPPALLTLDFRDQPNKEIHVLRARNARLIELADKQGC